MTGVWAWLRSSFVTGFFVMVPLVVSVVALAWLFRFADGLTAGLGERLLGRPWPGFGLIVTALIILLVGAIATNVIGRRLVDRVEHLLLMVPLFKTVYAPVRQLISAFSPDNEFGFKRMVVIDDPARGALLGFLTKEFTVNRGTGPQTLLAVYVPTNHLYLGDILLCSPERVAYPDLTVQEGIQVFLSGGTGMPDQMELRRGDGV